MFWYSESMKFLSLLSNNSQIGNSSLFWYNNFEQIILFPKNNTVNLKWFSFYDIGPNRDALKNNCYLATLHAQNKLEHQAIRAINVSLWLKTFDLPSNVIRYISFSVARSVYLWRVSVLYSNLNTSLSQTIECDTLTAEKCLFIIFLLKNSKTVVEFY